MRPAICWVVVSGDVYFQTMSGGFLEWASSNIDATRFMTRDAARTMAKHLRGMNTFARVVRIVPRPHTSRLATGGESGDEVKT